MYSNCIVHKHLDIQFNCIPACLLYIKVLLALVRRVVSKRLRMTGLMFLQSGHDIIYRYDRSSLVYRQLIKGELVLLKMSQLTSRKLRVSFSFIADNIVETYVARYLAELWNSIIFRAVKLQKFGLDGDKFYFFAVFIFVKCLYQ